MGKILVYTLLLLMPLAGHAQEKKDSAGVTKDPGFLLTSVSYTTNNNSSRMTNAIKMPALMANAAYYSTNGLSASASYYKYLSPDTNTYELEFRAGYEKTFFDHLDVEVSYTNRTFRGDEAYEGITYRHDLGLSGAYRLGDLTLNADNSLLIGPTKNYFLDLSLSYDFTFDRVLLKNGYLAFSPTLTASFGTNFWVQGTIDHIWGKGRGVGPGGMHPGTFVPKRNFEYQNFSLILPVQYTVGSFTLSGGWFYAIPSATLKEMKWTNQSGFLVSFNYAFIF